MTNKDKVELISVTQPSDYNNNPEELIAYCARVSNPSNQHNHETAPKLLNFCIRHGHWSIFEMVDMCVSVETSRAIAAQIIRHRSFSFQEFSQRYSKVPSIQHIELRSQGKTNRQVGEDIINPSLSDSTKADEKIKQVLQDTQDCYNKLIDAGVARESARMIMPMASTTKLYMKGSIRSWIHYINLRTKEDTQKEHREIAELIKKIFVSQFPIVSKALDWA